MWLRQLQRRNVLLPKRRLQLKPKQPKMWPRQPQRRNVLLPKRRLQPKPKQRPHSRVHSRHHLPIHHQ
jgi:hypothetical protein